MASIQRIFDFRSGFIGQRFIAKGSTRPSHNLAFLSLSSLKQHQISTRRTYHRAITLQTAHKCRFLTTGPKSTSKAEEELDIRHREYGGPIGEIRDMIYTYKHKKWGLLIYRCDYTSNEAWSRFLEIVQEGIVESLDLLGGDDLKDTLEMTPKEDKDLDGATVDQVREKFKIWSESDEAKAEANNDRYYKDRNPRYTYCVHVDADVLDAVLVRAQGLPLHEALRTAYVNLVQLRSGINPKYVEDDDEFIDIAKVGITALDADTYSILDRNKFDRMVRHIDDNGVAL